MRSPNVLAASLLVFGLGSSLPAGGAWASPSTSSPMAATQIAAGCGIGRTRDAAGRCRHSFNLFRHHGRFQAYKDRHCEKVRTPNGGVNRCKI